jgi:acetyl esterase
MIDPQAEALRAAFNAGPPLNEVGVEQARRWLAEARARRSAQTEVAKVVDLDTGIVSARLYHPSPAQTLPVLVFAHGGGWILGSVETSDEACRRLANEAHCAVVSVEYRLAPEARHPAPVLDLLDVIGWVPSVAAEHGLDARRIGIAGESSGGQIALAAALAARRVLAAQLLVCPALDRTMSTKSWATYGDDYVPRRAQMAWMWDQYLGKNDEYRGGAPDPWTAMLDRLPPTVVVVAQYDPLRDEGLDLLRRMVASHIQVELVDGQGQIHPVFANAAAVEASNRTLKQAARAIGRLLAGPDGANGHG